ncbi:hypothetical protein [Fusibacter sp. JL216-2]|uniref:hypothetical protein n=1 Tax=Fusibacter sp. JL216-2 TaxID=3071453 RepID=UPI003D337811
MAEKKEEKGGALKTILILLVVLIVLPVAVLSGFYFLSSTFQIEANKMLSNVPGPVGTYFEQFPTPQETNQQLKEIAEYYLDIDHSRAVDKLALLSTEDQAVYDEVIKHMLRMNPNATKLILEAIRDSNIKKDVVLNTLDQIQEEKNEEIKSRADYLASLSIQTAIDEMNFIINSSVNGHKSLASYIAAMDSKVGGTLMEQLSSEDFNKVISFMSEEKARDIRTTIADLKKRKSELENIASIYSSEDNTTLVDLIGNTNTYTIEELGKLYSELGPIKAGQVLARIGDDNFTFELINEIRDQQIIESGTDKITSDILKSLKIYKEFDDNVTEMAEVYGNMDAGVVSNMLQRMIRNSSAPKLYDLENGETIIISDEDIALELLSRFDKTRVGELLATFDDTLASDISRKLTLPRNQ